MSETGRVETLFSGGAEAPELDNYRPLSPLVVLACVAALASSLAVVHPLLWVIPVVAAALSASAIVRLSSPHSRYGGRNAAIAALCLAALFGSYAPARTISRDQRLYAEARAKADEWLHLLQQGRLHEAHQLAKDPSERYAGPGSLASHYAKVPPRQPPSEETDELEMMSPMGATPAEQLEEFMLWPAVTKLLEMGERASIEHIQNVAIHSEFGALKITHRYRISGVPAGQSDRESVDFLISSTRQEEHGVAIWKTGELGIVEQ